MINRRSLITGLISLVAAPAIVRAGSLMPVKVLTGAELFAAAVPGDSFSAGVQSATDYYVSNWIPLADLPPDGAWISVTMRGAEQAFTHQIFTRFVRQSR